MIKIFLILAIAAFCFGGIVEQVGDRNVAVMEQVYFDPGSTDTDSATTVLLYNSNIYVDSSGTWKQINSTADSCSYPFYLTDDQGSVQPQYFKSLTVTSTSTRDDSNAVKLNVETRERYLNTSYAWAWDSWVKVGREQGDGNMTIRDTVVTADSDSAVAVRQKLNFWVTGVQARLCPEIPGTTATDSVQFSDIRYTGR